MPQTIDLINFPLSGTDVSQWPKLTCTQLGHLDLQDAGLRLPASRDIFFQDNGQIRSGDDTHRLVFDRAGGLLELHEAGAIRLLTGSPTPIERLRILATGEVGIGTATPTSALHVTGDMRTDGGLRVAGQAVVGGMLTVSGTVGIGTATPTQPLEVVGTVKATSFQGSGAELTGVSGTDSTKVAKAGDTMSGALAITAAGTALSVTSNAAVGGTLTVGSNVGIGTISPGKALDVVGQGVFRAASWTGIAVPGVAGTVIGFDPASFGGLGFLWAHTTTGATTILWLDGNPIIFAPHAVERMRVDIAGNVGIGTASPASRLHVNGDIRFTGNLIGGGKGGYVMDQFVNGLGEALEQGDVVVVGAAQPSLSYGPNNNIPIPEVEVAQHDYDTRVCGIVSEVYGELRSDADHAATPGTRVRRGNAPHTFTPEELEQRDRTQVGAGQIGWMVTLGAFAHCKVDADVAPITAGDLLTTSSTRGHAQKVLDPGKAVGAIIGKALGSLHKGNGKIPVLVLLQ